MEEKRWSEIEMQWELGRMGEASSDLAESIMSLTTWILMIMREGLSMYQHVYPWMAKNKEVKGPLKLPRLVRRELLAAAVCLLMVGQDLTIAWSEDVYMMDASDAGGGCVCNTKQQGGNPGGRKVGSDGGAGQNS